LNIDDFFCFRYDDKGKFQDCKYSMPLLYSNHLNSVETIQNKTSIRGFVTV
jgi:hypothetical protein